MALRKGFGAQSSGANADDIRYDFAGTVVRNASGVPRSGLFPPVASSLLTPTATMAVGIAAFSGVALRDNGVVLLANDGAATVTLTAAPSSNSRLDVIYAKQNDASPYVTTPDGNNTPVFGVLAGIASALPVRNPSGLPQGAIELGTVLVPSTATNTGSSGVLITPTFQYTAMAGGVVQVRNKTERDASTWMPGQQVWRQDKLREETYFDPAGGTAYGWYPTGGRRLVVEYSNPAGTANGFGTSASKAPNLTNAILTETDLATWASGTFTMVIGGYVRVSAKMTLDNISGAASIYIYKNGAAVAESAAFGSTVSGLSILIDEVIKVAAGDTLELWNIGAPFNPGRGAVTGYNRMTIEYMGAA